VDGKATTAYSVGLNSIYLNLARRESDRTVKPEDRNAVVDRIVRRLDMLRDPLTGGPAVAKAYRARDVYRGQAAESVPDIIAGWNAGYRSSWQTAFGRVSAAHFRGQHDEWRGDRRIAAHLVPGVFLSNPGALS
jgi:predicted AlkP superfamily phosphohydrolase/phosphomutase